MGRRWRAVRRASSKVPSRQLGARGDEVGTARGSVATASGQVTATSDKEAVDIRSVRIARRSRTIVSHSISPSSGRRTSRGAERTAAIHVSTLPSRASTRPNHPIHVSIRSISLRSRQRTVRGRAISTGERPISLRFRRRTVASAERTALGHAISIFGQEEHRRAGRISRESHDVQLCVDQRTAPSRQRTSRIGVRTRRGRRRTARVERISARVERRTTPVERISTSVERISARGERRTLRVGQRTTRVDVIFIRERPLHAAGRTHISSRARHIPPSRRRSVAAPRPLVPGPE